MMYINSSGQIEIPLGLPPTALKALEQELALRAIYWTSSLFLTAHNVVCTARAFCMYTPLFITLFFRGNI